jgi:hypothetical protein
MNARAFVTSLVGSLLPLLSAVASGAPMQAGTQSSGTPSAIEQALVEYRCDQTRAPGAPRTDVFQECLRVQLVSLRDDFGSSLSRLSAAERRMLDSACNRVSEVRGRQAYVGCMSEQLVALSGRRARARPAVPTAKPAPLAAAPAAPTARPAPPSAPPAQPAATAEAPIATSPLPEATEAPTIPAPAAAPSPYSPLLVGLVIVGLSLMAVAAFMTMRARGEEAAVRACRICGGDVQDSGDLCQKCRHDAAAAVKRASTERADQQHAQREALRQQEEEEKQRRLKTFEEEEQRLRQQEAARQADIARREEESRRRDEQLRLEQEARDAAAKVFDPHAILGVPQGASEEAIRAAYEEALAKYDPEHVAHLGPELKAHFKKKAEAVERAYRLLTA